MSRRRFRCLLSHGRAGLDGVRGRLPQEAAAGRRRRPPPPPPAPHGAATAAPAAPPAAAATRPRRRRPPTEAELFARMSLEELNAQKPLEDVFFALRQVGL